jgi:hypothetical protein
MRRMASVYFVLLTLASMSPGCAQSRPQATTPLAVIPTTVAGSGHPAAATPFAGRWESCAGADAPDQCSRYLLLQRGTRICGTWSYFASGDGFEGRVIAEARSPLEARRIRICGRPGSETATECEVGWHPIDRPLRLCDGRLGDLDGKDGGCFADFERMQDGNDSLASLAREPWVQACLSGKEE